MQLHSYFAASQLNLSGTQKLNITQYNHDNLLLILFACNPVPLEYSSEEQGCQNWDPNAEAESSLNIYFEGEELVIQRTGVLQHCEAQFSPIIEQQDSYKLSIREYWTTSDATVDCETCFSPSVRLTSYPNRDLEFGGISVIVPFPST